VRREERREMGEERKKGKGADGGGKQRRGKRRRGMLGKRGRREGEEIRSPSLCEHHPPVSYTRFLSQPQQTP